MTNKLLTPPHVLSHMPSDSPILLALSGGADSRALLSLLCEYCRSTGAPLYAAHVNHMIRGDDAVRDRDFCRDVCKSLGVRCFTLDCDVPAIARERGIGIEQAARDVRYEFFMRLMREHNIPILATAHNADDVLETLIFNVSRGSGLRGIGSIPEAREFGDGILIRPLLHAPKDDIIEYCRENGLDFVTDATNADDIYSRNYIRLHIIPLLKQLNSGVLTNAARLCSAARLDEDFIQGQVEQYFVSSGGDANLLSSLRALHPALLCRVLSRLYADASGGKVAEQVHISALCELIERGVGNSALSLPGLVRAQIKNKRLIFVPDPRKSFRHL